MTKPAAASRSGSQPVAERLPAVADPFELEAELTSALAEVLPEPERQKVTRVVH